MNINQALATLDPENDDHWTSDGLPRMEVVEDLVGDKSIKRKDVTDADPEFTRETAKARKTETPDEPNDDTASDEPDAGTDAPDGSGDDPEPDGDAGSEEGEPQVQSQDGDEQGDPEDDEPVDEDEAEGPSLDDILLLEYADVAADPELMEAYITAASIKGNELARERDRLTEELKTLGFRQELISRTLQRYNRANPKKNANPIGDYIRRQHEARQKRAERAQAFLEGGTSAADVIEQLRVGSKLDAAMRQRKPALGSTRPDPRLPVQRGSIVND